MGNFRDWDRDTVFLLPPSLNEWLPEQHLARFVAANEHPDHEQIEGLFVKVLLLAKEPGFLKLGTVGLEPEAALRHEPGKMRKNPR